MQFLDSPPVLAQGDEPRDLKIRQEEAAGAGGGRGVKKITKALEVY